VIASNMPNSNTPTTPALQSAIQYARTFTMTNMGARTVAVLLVTDGLPNGCNSTIQQVADLAKQGFEGTPSIKTFVINLRNTAALNQVTLANSGGATHYIPTMGDVTGTLTTALSSISSMSTYVYSIPTAPSGPTDLQRVNLELRVGSN